MVISAFQAANCNLERLSSTGGGAEVPWNGPPERVTAPYVAPPPNELVSKSRVVLYCSPKREINFF